MEAAVGPDHPILDLVGGPRLDGFVKSCHHCLPVIGMDQAEQPLSGCLFLRRQSKDGLAAGREIDRARHQVEVPLSEPADVRRQLPALLLVA